MKDHALGCTWFAWAEQKRLLFCNNLTIPWKEYTSHSLWLTTYGASAVVAYFIVNATEVYGV